MIVEFLFNSSGNWICFKIGKNIFNLKCEWIGWLPWDDFEVVTVKGDYLGTICDKDRIYNFSMKPFRGYPGFPGYPGYPGFPGHPGYAGYSPLPIGATDIKL